MSDQQVLLDTLEHAIAIKGDPADAIYQRLFDRHPKLETLFSMDRDGGVRGSMLEQAYDCLIDLTGDGRLAGTILSMERQNHDSYGVPDELFMSLFEIMHDIIRESHGAAWSQTQEQVWLRLLKQADLASRRN